MCELKYDDFTKYFSRPEDPIEYGPNMSIIKLPEVDDDLWEPALVPISSEWIDERTQVIHYERRHRLYVNVLMDALGFPAMYPGRYWEKSSDGTIILHD